MKGTIFLFTSLPCFLLALIPVPMKGTITVYYDIVKPLMSFNPRTHEGYDINQTRLSELDTILIPVPMKGTICLLLV